MRTLLDIQLDIRLTIYFSLSLNQKRHFNDRFRWQNMETVPMHEFKKITRSKRLHSLLSELKQSTIKKIA